MNMVPTSFRVYAASLSNNLCPDTAIAASRAGHCGLLDLEHAALDGADVGAALRALQRAARGQWGLKLRAGVAAEFCESRAQDLCGITTLLLCGDTAALTGKMIDRLRAAFPAVELLAEIRDVADLSAIQRAGVDGLVAKGNEAGGAVGDKPAFLLLQHLVGQTDLPVYAHGGIGPHSAAACRVAGASGVLLDWQLALFPESGTPRPLAQAVARMDGSETIVLGADRDRPHRVYWRADHAPARALNDLDNAGGDSAAFVEALNAAVDPTAPERSLWLIGQDAALAGALSRRHRTLGGALSALQRQSGELIDLARDLAPLGRGGPLAQANGTDYPILQGPMTRVSDVPDFALAVAEAGALPFSALALMRGEEADRLLAETRAKLGERPWGVGILGFIDDDLRQEQVAAITAHRPGFAVIAGGRPEQATALEAEGIATYLHVPSPGLVSLFLNSGARRLIFEGRECGGHVGPRASAVLWQQAVDALLDHFGPDDPIDCEIIFAGGVHDGVSGAMVSALSAELAQRGARIGVIVGTAYLLTEEAVTSGAILPNYQSLALDSDRTTLLTSAPGHSTRVVRTPVVDEFLAEKLRLHAEGTDPDEIKDRLERFNIGRSRIASKGIDRNPDFGRDPKAPKFVQVPDADQTRTGLFMIGQVADLHDRPTTMAELHAAICDGAAQVLAERAPHQRAAPEYQGPGARIAITGIGTILPGSTDAAGYWETILDKRHVVQEVPERRWDWRRYYDADRDAPDKAYSKWGGFVDEIRFDPIRYGIPPLSVPSIEPLQLLALEVVRQALEDAGFPDGVIPDPELRRRTSVIIGVGGGTGPLGQCYATRATLPAINGEIPPTARHRLPEWTEDSFPGILINVIAGRVANRFDLGGVNFTVDAACGSSLAAVMAAAREIETGTSDMVIVGGADSFQNPFDFIAFSKTGALSPRGVCRTFDATADGITISEGLAFLVLRKLEHAEADGDRIYAVLRGVGGASDGRGLSLTAPRSEGQQAALHRAYRRAGVSPASVGLVEAHGTGTVVGDRTELESVVSFFKEVGADRQTCGVGSVKSMIGHTKAAAGSAGLVKAAMALHTKVLPATLHVEAPNEGVDFDDSPVYLLTDTRPWLKRDDEPRRAGVSAFGFGGTNFHAVLEEYQGGYLPRHQAPLRRNWTHELFLFSADRPEALADALRTAATALAGAPADLRPADLAAALAETFDAGAGARFAVVAGALDDLAGRLERAAQQIAQGDSALKQTDPQGAWFSAEDPIGPDQTAFLFPGQGAQYPGMAADMAMHFPQVRHKIEAAARHLEGRTPDPLDELIYPRPALTEAERAEQAEALKRADCAQPAIGAVSVAMLSLLRGLGLQAGCHAGHSFGEYSALHAAGAFDADTLMTLAHARGDAMIREGGDDLGAMAAVGCGAEELARVLDGVPGVTLANLNAPDQTVIAGPTAAIEAAVPVIEAARLPVKMLPVACGFHSDCVAPAARRLAKVLEEAPIGAPGVPVYANATAAPYPGTPAKVRAQLVSHLTDPVAFQGLIEAMHDAGTRLFIEVGPSAVLSGLTDRILRGRPYLAVATDRKDRPGVQQLLCALGAASVAGHALDLASLWDQRVSRPVDVVTWNLQIDDPLAGRPVWMVDPARAHPVGEPPKTIGMSARIEDDPVPGQIQENYGGPAMANDSQNSGSAPAPAPLAGGYARTGAEAAMQRHQELMARFLETNRSVMMAYLGGQPEMPGLAAPLAQPQAPAPAPMPVAAPAPVAQPPVAAAP
ncbi:type I polyketide synthase, partial [Rhodovulum adriaticum]